MFRHACGLPHLAVPSLRAKSSGSDRADRSGPLLEPPKRVGDRLLETAVRPKPSRVRFQGNQVACVVGERTLYETVSLLQTLLATVLVIAVQNLENVCGGDTDKGVNIVCIMLKSALEQGTSGNHGL